MKIDIALQTSVLADVPDRARELEALGCDGIYTLEGAHDPFFPILLGAGATERVDLLTEVAIALSRNPMIVANIADDLQTHSRGRFILGLGSQIRPHIERRYSQPWSAPAARMREFILAIRAIWRAWGEGETLDFRGRFYTHTLMTPTFNPGPNPFGNPPIYLAAVGPKMNEAAGEVADGVFLHPFSTPAYLAETILPSVEKGLAKSGRTRSQFGIGAQVMVGTGLSDEAVRESRERVRSLIGFYGSTPAYRPVLEAHGWGALQDELNALSKAGRWGDMAAVIPDEVVETISVCGAPDEVAARLHERFDGIVDRIGITGSTPPDVLTGLMRELN